MWRWMYPDCLALVHCRSTAWRRHAGPGARRDAAAGPAAAAAGAAGGPAGAGWHVHAARRCLQHAHQAELHGPGQCSSRGPGRAKRGSSRHGSSRHRRRRHGHAQRLLGAFQHAGCQPRLCAPPARCVEHWLAGPIGFLPEIKSGGARHQRQAVMCKSGCAAVSGSLWQPSCVSYAVNREWRTRPGPAGA
jgi:hypothetical protein